MLRMKISLAYIVLASLLIVSSVGLIHFNVSDIIDANTAQALQRAVVGAEQSVRLDEASLLARARYVASSDRLYRSLKGEFVGEVAEGDKEPAEKVDVEGQRHLDAHEKLSAQRYRVDELTKAAKGVRNEERHLLAREPHELDIFMVLDDKGAGVAALGKDLYSWFGADISKQFPGVKEVVKGDIARIEYWMWSFKAGDEKRLYRVAVAPVRRTNEEAPAGVVVLGAMINDGLAKGKQALVAGGGEDVNLDGAPEVAFYHGDSIVGSTFSTEEQNAVVAALKAANLMNGELSEATALDVSEAPHLAISRPLESGETPVGLVVIANLDEARSPLTSLRVNVMLLGIFLLVFGIFLLVFVVVRYIKPVEDLEDGVQEVIAGNKDYVWPQLKGHELQSGLAQQLNLMSAFLQGKPMPDDDNTGQSWGDLMPGGGEKPSGPGQVQGVDLAGLMGAAPPKRDDGEG